MYKVNGVQNNPKVTRKVQTLKIVHDVMPENPREWDNLGTFVGREHRNYTIGDKQAEVAEAMLDALHENGLIADSTFERLYENAPAYFTDEEKAQISALFEKHFISLNVYMYDHSGVAFSTTPFNCQWDAGRAGIIFISKERARKEYNIKRITPAWKEKIEGYLAGEIETYNQWQSGDVWGFELWEHYEDEDYDDGEEIDSCYGFYGRDIDKNGIKDHVDMTMVTNIIEE